jgi:Ni,Fe-hydrogenase I small subunit
MPGRGRVRSAGQGDGLSKESVTLSDPVDRFFAAHPKAVKLATANHLKRSPWNVVAFRGRMANLLWLQGGACSGNTMSFLNAEEPSVCDLVTDFGINILWHPSLGLELGDDLKRILNRLVSGEVKLDVLVFEGTVVNAPNGTGAWNRFAGRPMKDWLKELSRAANYIVAIGDCATWGGIPAMAPNPSESSGLQFLKRNRGGYLGTEYRSKAGLPVINVPGCPAHPDWITQIIVAVATGRGGELALDDLQRPKTFFTSFTQTGCTRNMHFAYKISATEFGQRKGCLFYDLGCRTSCNRAGCHRPSRCVGRRIASRRRPDPGAPARRAGRGAAGSRKRA